MKPALYRIFISIILTTLLKGHPALIRITDINSPAHPVLMRFYRRCLAFNTAAEFSFCFPAIRGLRRGPSRPQIVFFGAGRVLHVDREKFTPSWFFKYFT